MCNCNCNCRSQLPVFDEESERLVTEVSQVTDEDLRLVALGFAVNLVNHLNDNPYEIVSLAKEFTEFLSNG